VKAAFRFARFGREAEDWRTVEKKGSLVPRGLSVRIRNVLPEFGVLGVMMV
jgi:hypothetical protein